MSINSDGKHEGPYYGEQLRRVLMDEPRRRWNPAVFIVVFALLVFAAIVYAVLENL